MAKSCGFPAAQLVNHCDGALVFVDEPDHVRGLAIGGHKVVDDKVFLCKRHATVVCGAMAGRGVTVVVKPYIDENAN